MSSLTRAVHDPHSRVARWLHAEFPYHRSIQARFREAAGSPKILPPPTVAYSTQAGAIDWWVRFLVDPRPDLRLALHGVLMMRGHVCFDAGIELLTELGALDRTGQLLPVNPRRMRDRDDEWWARVCYALALLVEPYRGGNASASRLLMLSESAGTEQLLGLANQAEVEDLIAMRDLALTHLLPGLPEGEAASGATFDGSRELAADADVIIGGTLLEIKAAQGGRRRADGTRVAHLSRPDVDHLLGCALLDYSDTFELDTVGIYAARFGCLMTWTLEELCVCLAGHDVNFAHKRVEFKHLVRSGEDRPLTRD